MFKVVAGLICYAGVAWFLRAAHTAKSSGEELGSLTNVALACLTTFGTLGVIQLIVIAKRAGPSIEALFLCLAALFIVFIPVSAAYAWLGSGFSRAQYEEAGEEIAKNVNIVEHISRKLGD